MSRAEEELELESRCRVVLEAARLSGADEGLRSSDLQQIVRKRGWPRRFRPLLWLKYSGAQSRMRGQQGYYSLLVKRKCPDECGPRQVG